ncbi:MAG: hypothetical protein WC728_03210 [Elusimicrobiota bacterium]
MPLVLVLSVFCVVSPAQVFESSKTAYSVLWRYENGIQTAELKDWEAHGEPALRRELARLRELQAPAPLLSEIEAWSRSIRARLKKKARGKLDSRLEEVGKVASAQAQDKALNSMYEGFSASGGGSFSGVDATERFSSALDTTSPVKPAPVKFRSRVLPAPRAAPRQAPEIPLGVSSRIALFRAVERISPAAAAPFLQEAYCDKALEASRNWLVELKEQLPSYGWKYTIPGADALLEKGAAASSGEGRDERMLRKARWLSEVSVLMREREWRRTPAMESAFAAQEEYLLSF